MMRSSRFSNTLRVGVMVLVLTSYTTIREGEKKQAFSHILL